MSFRTTRCMSGSGKVAPQVTQISLSKAGTWRSHLYPTESHGAEEVAEIYTTPISAADRKAGCSRAVSVWPESLFLVLQSGTSGVFGFLFVLVLAGSGLLWRVHFMKAGSWKAVRRESSGKEPRCPLGTGWECWVRGNALPEALNAFPIAYLGLPQCF